ncbi:hypothetical protein FV233_25225 [Methylobacterium sp. WL7]|nr:hypothetical protein FV233_25225 [Methylobacterium sp. WL7]
MIEQAPRAAREFHVGPGGDRWFLMRDLSTGQPYVLHRPTDETEVELDLGSFLVLFRGEERASLMQLIASLLPDEAALDDGAVNVVGPLKFMSRWIAGRPN